MKNNANFALIIAESQDDNDEFADDTVLQRFLETAKKKLTPFQDIVRIHPNIWQIPLSSGLPAIAALIQCAAGDHIPLRLLFLEELPAWIRLPPPATKSS